jgi:F0F1-type ATP synthase membrane subunit b/b'
MGQREEPDTLAKDEERAEARAEFRRKLAEAEAQMTPEKRDKVRAAFGLDTRAA